MHFEYGETELSYLRQKDKRLCQVIDRIGHIDRRLFEKYRRRFSPYCSVARLYLWAVVGGAIPDMRDYRPQKKEQRKLSAARKEGTV